MMLSFQAAREAPASWEAVPVTRFVPSSSEGMGGEESSGPAQPRQGDSGDWTLLEHRLTLQGIGEVRVALLPGDRGESLAMCFGPTGPSSLVRLQSRCTYGEVFGSLGCDCRDQLAAAWGRIVEQGTGVVIYLDQEGRGAGAVAKARAHVDHERWGLDTFESYRRQGVPGDAREYGAAVRLLRALGIHSLQLLTNNPEKIQAMASAGFVVEREGLLVQSSTSADNYLDAKRTNGYLI